MSMKPRAKDSETASRGHYLKRMGLAGFAFFFLKGLAWLLVPWLAHSAIF